MTELEKKLEKLDDLHSEMREANRVLTMKTGQFEDLLKEITQKHLSIPADQKEISISTLIRNSYLAGKQ